MSKMDVKKGEDYDKTRNWNKEQGIIPNWNNSIGSWGRAREIGAMSL
jgi:hypothetical protein